MKGVARWVPSGLAGLLAAAVAIGGCGSGEPGTPGTGGSASGGANAGGTSGGSTGGSSNGGGGGAGTTGAAGATGGTTGVAGTTGAAGAGGAGSTGTGTGTGGTADGGAAGTTGNAGTTGTGGTGGTAGRGGAAGTIGDAGTTGGTTGAAGRAGAGGGTGGRGGSTGAAGTGGGAGGGGAGGATGPRFHVFLLLGQSNMAGYAKAQDADKVENERVRVLGFDACTATGRQQDKWDVAAPPLHECWNGAVGPGDWFAKTILDEIPAGDTIGLVPCAISGEKIETFLKVGGTKYAWILQRARAAQQAGGVIEGMLFHQGESNCGDASWPGKVNTLVSDLRADLGLGNVPFLAGELVHGGACAQHNTQVNRLPTVVSNAHVVSASGLALDPADTQWRLHFGHDATVTLGKRYAAKLIEVLGW